jgi:hypothetical protein
MSKQPTKTRSFPDQALRTAERISERLALTPRISAVRQWVLWTVISVLVLTGALWLWAEYAYTPSDNGMEPYAIKHYAMVLHAAFALAFVFFAGTLLHTHMQAAWRQQRNRATGAVMATTVTLLTLSGFALWYAGGETLRQAAEIAHWVTGFGLPMVLMVHMLAGTRRHD